MGPSSGGTESWELPELVSSDFSSFCCSFPASFWIGQIFYIIPFYFLWRRKWQPTPVFLPGKSHGQRSLVGYSPGGCKELDMTECVRARAHTHTHTHLFIYTFLISHLSPHAWNFSLDNVTLHKRVMSFIHTSFILSLSYHLLFFLSIYLFGCAGSYLWHVRSSFLTRDRTHAPCTGAQSLSHWTMREVPHLLLYTL